MKKIFISMIAVAAVAACAKTEVAYEAPEAISFKAASQNVTKADGQLLEATHDLVVYAEVSGVKNSDGTDVPAYTWFEEQLFEFANNGWYGDEAICVWPVEGNLQFKGYTKPNTDTHTVPTAAAGEAITTLNIKNYVTDNSYDLGYFFTPVVQKGDVTVSVKHALSKVTCVVDASKNNTISDVKVELLGVNNTGDMTATATVDNEGNVTSNVNWVRKGSTVANKTLYENQAANTYLVIPGDGVTVKVTYTKTIGTGHATKTQEFTAANSVATWNPGFEYTYKVVFNEEADATAIKIVANTTEWQDGGTTGVTVQ